jgi:hypothetical protein
MGGVLVHPDVEGLAEQYGGAVATYPRGNMTALADLVDGLLDDPDRRRRMRQVGPKVIAAGHLWRHRLVDIARTCGVL